MDFLIREEILKFKNRFNELEIEVGDKLYYDENDTINVIKSGYLQSVTRIIYFQDRHGFYEKFKKDIKRLNKIFKGLLLDNNIFFINFSQKNILFVQEIRVIHNKLLDILKILKETYKDDSDYIDKLIELELSINSFYVEYS